MARIPQPLPIRSKRFGKLFEWLNQLREAVISLQPQVPHNLKVTQGEQGLLFEGEPGGGTTTSNDLPVWL